MRVRNFVCTVLVGLSLVLSSVSPALAWERGQGRAAAAAAAGVASGGGLTEAVNMDLSSTTRSLSASALGLANTVNINVGGAVRSVGAGDVLTPAELMAVSQVMSGGIQSLKLGADGNAVRGRFTLSSDMAAQLTGLVIPVGVKLVQDFGALASLSFSGDLVNSGRIFAFSSSSAQTNAAFNAQNIFNQTTGVITSMAEGPMGRNSVPNLGMTLSAVDNLVNEGRIISAGDLNLSAGGTITNAGQAGRPPALMHAMGDMNVWSPNVVNSGAMASLNGNANFNTVTAVDMNINNLGGQILAPTGAINLRDANYVGAANTNLTGGDLISKTLNLNTGNGVTNVDVRQLTGVVNSTGYGAHISAATGDLLLGDLNLIDPTFYNASGNIQITGTVSASEAIAIIASGNITAGTNGKISATDGTNGKNITLIAGAVITPCDTCTNSSTLPSGGNAVPSGKTIFVDVENGAGANIDLSGSTQSTLIDASGTSTGGTITLAAVGDGASKGKITLPSSGSIVINGSAGKVVIVADAQSGTGITTGPILVNGAGGTITMATKPVATDNGSPLEFNADGSTVGNHYIIPGLPNEDSTAGIQLNRNVYAASNLNIFAGGDLLSLETLAIIASPNMNLTSVHGTVQGSSNPNALMVVASSLSGPGTLNLTGHAYANVRVVDTLTGDLVVVSDSSAGNLFGVVSQSGITLNDVSASAIQMQTYFGAILVAPNAQIAANYGIILSNLDTNGTILIGANASMTVLADKSDPGDIFIGVGGAIPFQPVFGSTPSNVLSSSSRGGHVFFGENGISASSPDNTIAADINNIIFDTGDLDASHISLGGGVHIETVSSYNPLLLSSLDLTDPATVNAILAGQANDGIGGHLITSGGIATGGTLVVEPSNLYEGIDALNIPQGVSVTFRGFHYYSPINIDLTASSTSASAVVNGIQHFDIGPKAIVNISSSNPGPVLTVGANGNIISDGHLVISASSDVLVNGLINGPGGVEIHANGNIRGEGSIFSHDVTLTALAGDIGSVVTPLNVASYVAPDYLFLIAQASGSVWLRNPVSGDKVLFSNDVSSSSAGSIFSLSAKGAVIAQMTTTAIASPVIILKTTGGNIGTSAIQPLAVVRAPGANNLILQASGSIYVSDQLCDDCENVHPIILSLDLTNSDAVSIITGYQAIGFLGGTLEISGGVATGGNLILGAINLVEPLTALNIPHGVTIEFTGFSESTNAVNVGLSSASNTGQAIVEGNGVFTDSPSGAVNISSTLGGPVLTLASTGQILGDGNLIINAGGAVLLNGSISAPQVTVNTTTPSNGNITVGGIIGAANGATIINASGSGRILRSLIGVVQGSSVTLTSSTGDIGSNVIPIQTSAGMLTLQTAGNVFVSESNGVVLGASTATGTLELATASDGSITVGANSSAGTIKLTADGSGVIDSSGNFTLAGTIVNLTSGDGDIGSSTTSIHTSAGTLILNTDGSAFVAETNSVILGASIAVDTIELTTANNGSITVGADSSAGTMKLTAHGNGSIDRSGNFTLTGTTVNLASTSGDIGSNATPILSFFTQSGRRFLRDGGIRMVA
jgi:hypothetical protein